ncbi:hypothetical protein Sjap_008997 [Stephania japonica]|uniref:Uncharacterized protein n=1 Tax=Stephania japonica TaxID=461633 RepID=A0AAP0JQL3_9MAGN
MVAGPHQNKVGFSFSLSLTIFVSAHCLCVLADCGGGFHEWDWSEMTYDVLGLAGTAALGHHCWPDHCMWELSGTSPSSYWCLATPGVSEPVVAVVNYYYHVVDVEFLFAGVDVISTWLCTSSFPCCGGSLPMSNITST